MPALWGSGLPWPARPDPGKPGVQFHLYPQEAPLVFAYFLGLEENRGRALLMTLEVGTRHWAVGFHCHFSFSLIFTFSCSFGMIEPIFHVRSPKPEE